MTYPKARGFKFFWQDTWALFVWWWRIWGWFLIFCLGFASGHLADLINKPGCEQTAAEWFQGMPK